MVGRVKDIKSAYQFVKDGWAMVKKYGWYDRVTYPYSFPVKVTKMLHEIADYGKCTRMSQSYLNDLANGLGDILNSWEEFELAEKVEMVFPNGKVVRVLPDDVEVYELGGAVRKEA